MNSLTEPGLKQLRDNVMLIGGEVGRSVERAMQALISRDSLLAEQVLTEGNRIDALELESDHLGICVLALRAPKARDLRFVVSASKIISRLKRIRDQACTIARAAINFNNQAPVRLHRDLPQMAVEVAAMLSHSLIAFANADAEAARAIIERDHQIGRLYERLSQELLEVATWNPEMAGHATRLILMANHLLQIGDCTKEICQQIVYMKEACVIKNHRPWVQMSKCRVSNYMN
ncbi:MAG TPA: phosphate signaling complex protein PhoU, partial [Blastocatellia bacterium]|nr:phosphate signaling complex protein PhoU [Blastocatellia bacterium]